MSVIRLSCFFAAVALLFGIVSTANAQFGYGGFSGYGFGFGYGGVYSLEPPPYFATFPPVYYSTVTPRPYGFSPYAYPPGVMTPSPSVVATGGNRRYPRRPAAIQTSASAARPAPVIIENPFVLPPDKRPTRLADGRPLPQVIDLRNAAKPVPAPLNPAGREVLARASEQK
ncbi:MAG TPA: hypothetical protein VGJ26_04725 [Pirellulales bacterium]|jgi:hypothetical protein